MPFDIASAQQLAQPVTSFMQGRALRLAQDERVAGNQRAQEEHDVNMEQAKVQLGAVKAKKLYASMQQVLAVPEERRKQFVEENFPDLVKQMSSNGHDWASFDNGAITKMAQGIGAHAAAELGMTPDQGENFTLKPGEVRYQNGKKVAEAPMPDDMTPYQRAQLKLENDKLNFEKSKPSMGDKPPTGFQWKGDGSGLEFIPGGPADPAVAANTKNLRQIPPAAAQGIISNRASLGKIDRAMKALDDNPDAFGMQNYMPDAMTQRLPGKEYSGGVDPRAKVADIGSLLIHDRSGAAVTAAEFPRLKPFIPQSTDSPKTIKTKLTNLRANLAAMNEETESLYSPEAGYRPIPSGNSGVPDDIAALLKKHGKK